MWRISIMVDAVSRFVRNGIALMVDSSAGSLLLVQLRAEIIHRIESTMTSDTNPTKLTESLVKSDGQHHQNNARIKDPVRLEPLERISIFDLRPGMRVVAQIHGGRVDLSTVYQAERYNDDKTVDLNRDEYEEIKP